MGQSQYSVNTIYEHKDFRRRETIRKGFLWVKSIHTHSGGISMSIGITGTSPCSLGLSLSAKQTLAKQMLRVTSSDGTFLTNPALFRTMGSCDFRQVT